MIICSTQVMAMITTTMIDNGNDNDNGDDKQHS